MSTPTVYRYTYQPRGHDQTFQTRVTIDDRGERDGFVVYVLRPVDGVWPHRLGRDAEDTPLLRAITMMPAEEHEWLNVDLVAEGGAGTS